MVTPVGFEPNALHLEGVATYTARLWRHLNGEAGGI